MNKSNTLKKVYFDWLMKEYRFTDLDNHTVEISTPFLDNDFDHIILYAEFLNNGRVTLTDDGWTINNLKSHGVNLNGRTLHKNNILNTIVSSLGTELNNNELCITTSLEKFPLAKQRLLQTIMQVNDMIVLKDKNVKNIFYDEVEEILRKREVFFTSRTSFSGKEGITDADEYVARKLYKTHKPVILAVNKVDNPEMRNDIYDFYALGLGEPLPISSVHGIGTGDVLDAIVENLPHEVEEENPDVIKFSLIGRPNVGKSSLINAILGEDRVIASPVAGTTRDAIDTHFTDADGQEFTMIDTAGMRKSGKVYENTEKYSVMRAMRAIDRSDVVLMVLNAEEGIREYDKRIAGFAHEAGKGMIIVVNKWDTLEKDNHTMKNCEEDIREQFQYLPYAPIIFVSALTKQRLHKLPEMIKQISESQNTRIPSAVLNDVIMDAIAINPTPTDKGKRLKIFYATQVATKPPTFVIFVNEEELMHFSYLRFLENQIRKAFVFEGTPIHLIARKRK